MDPYLKIGFEPSGENKCCYFFLVRPSFDINSYEQSCNLLFYRLVWAGRVRRGGRRGTTSRRGGGVEYHTSRRQPTTFVNIDVQGTTNLSVSLQEGDQTCSQATGQEATQEHHDCGRQLYTSAQDHHATTERV